MFMALMWNEWRRQRRALIMLGVVNLMVWIILFSTILMNINIHISAYYSLVVLFLEAINVYVITTEIFAGEFRDKTVVILNTLPVSPWRIYWGKFAYTFGMVIVSYGVNWLLLLGWLELAGDQKIVLPVFLVIGSLILILHAAVFFTSLTFPRSHSGIGALLLWPLPAMLLFPAVVPLCIIVSDLTMINQNVKFVEIGIMIDLALLWLMLVMFGWYLWSRRRMLGKSLLKPLLIGMVALLTIPSLINASNSE